MKKAICMMGLLIVFMWVNALAYACGDPVTPDPIVIDNLDANAAYDETDWSLWSCSDCSEVYGDNLLHRSCTGNGAAVTWSTKIPTTGHYSVYAWWSAETDRVTNASYTINYEGGDKVEEVSQKIRGGQWNHLGTYYFFEEKIYSVVLSDNDDTDGKIIADAIKFEFGEHAYPYPVVIDNPYADFEGAWLSWDCSGWPDCSQLYGDDLYYIETSDTGTNKATWKTEIPAAGRYSVYAWWFAHPDRATNALYTINYEGGDKVKEVSQKIRGGHWNYLGTYDFGEGIYSVVLSDNEDTDGKIIADAIKFERGKHSYPYPIADNPDADFVGDWLSWDCQGTCEGDDLYYIDTSSPGDNTATWMTEIPAAGNYKIYARWVADTNRATNVTYTISHDGGPTPVSGVNQQENGGQWYQLGDTYEFAPGPATVVLTNANANGYVIADAIKWERQ